MQTELSLFFELTIEHIHGPGAGASTPTLIRVRNVYTTSVFAPTTTTTTTTTNTIFAHACTSLCRPTFVPKCTYREIWQFISRIDTRRTTTANASQ